MKKIGVKLVILYAVAISMLFTGCFSQSKSLSNVSSDQIASLTENIDINTNEKMSGNNNADVKANTTVKNTNIKKVIRDANIAIEVKNSDQDFKKISSWVTANGGYEFSRNVSSNGKYKNITVVYKVPPVKLDSFLDFLDGTGKIQSSNMNSNDITDQYYDIAARLDNLKKGREQLIEIQKKAVTIDQTLRVQSELNNITGEIESLQARINVWDKMVDESTVSLTVNQEPDPIKAAEEISWKFSSVNDVLKTAKSGFVLTTNALASIVVWIIIFVVSVSPVLIILGLIIIMVKVIKKRKKQ